MQNEANRSAPNFRKSAAGFKKADVGNLFGKRAPEFALLPAFGRHSVGKFGTGQEEGNLGSMSTDFTP